MKAIGNLLLGIVLFVLGVVMLLNSISVGTFHFYSFGGVSTAPILIILLIIFVVLIVVSSKWYTWVLFVADLLGIIVSVIMGTEFYFRHMSALTLVIMVCVLGAGIGLFIKGMIQSNKEIDV